MGVIGHRYTHKQVHPLLSSILSSRCFLIQIIDALQMLGEEFATVFDIADFQNNVQDGAICFY